MCDAFLRVSGIDSIKRNPGRSGTVPAVYVNHDPQLKTRQGLLPGVPLTETPVLSSAKTGTVIGRSRQNVDSYIAGYFFTQI